MTQFLIVGHAVVELLEAAELRIVLRVRAEAKVQVNAGVKVEAR